MGHAALRVLQTLVHEGFGDSFREADPVLSARILEDAGCKTHSSGVCAAAIVCSRHEQGILTAKLADPLFFKKPATEVTQATVRLHEIEAELAKAYARLGELE